MIRIQSSYSLPDRVVSPAGFYNIRGQEMFEVWTMGNYKTMVRYAFMGTRLCIPL